MILLTQEIEMLIQGACADFANLSFRACAPRCSSGFRYHFSEECECLKEVVEQVVVMLGEQLLGDAFAACHYQLSVGVREVGGQCNLIVEIAVDAGASVSAFMAAIHYAHANVEDGFDVARHFKANLSAVGGRLWVGPSIADATAASSQQLACHILIPIPR